MKQIILTILILLCIKGYSQLSKPVVDKRCEIVSIAFRLANSKEYSSTIYKQYTDKIEAHFGKFKDHEIVDFIKSIRKEGIGYDVPMSLAVNLDDNFNLIKDGSYNSRWNKETAQQFLALLKKFAKDSDFNEFYDNNKDMYSEILNRFNPLYEMIDVKWYNSFFGKEPGGKFIIILCPSNGGSNYGINVTHKNGDREVYSLMGVWRTDSTGVPLFDINQYLPTFIHEFAHSFANLSKKNQRQFEVAANKVFSIVKDDMKEMAYGNWQTMVNESLVRASVVQYLKDHKTNPKEIENTLQNDVARGFVWQPLIVEEFEKYSSQRDIYTTFEDFLPQLAKAYEKCTYYTENFEESRPKILSINEFNNNCPNLDPNTKTITINFDRALSAKGYSIKQSNKSFPKMTGFKYTNQNKSFLIDVKLDKNQEYELILTGSRFKSTEDIPIRNYSISFKTTD